MPNLSGDSSAGEGYPLIIRPVLLEPRSTSMARYRPRPPSLRWISAVKGPVPAMGAVSRRLALRAAGGRGRRRLRPVRPGPGGWCVRDDLVDAFSDAVGGEAGDVGGVGLGRGDPLGHVGVHVPTCSPVTRMTWSASWTRRALVSDHCAD